MVVCYLLFNSNTILDMDNMESNKKVMGTFLLIACTVYVVWCLWPAKRE